MLSFFLPYSSFKSSFFTLLRYLACSSVEFPPDEFQGIDKSMSEREKAFADTEHINKLKIKNDFFSIFKQVLLSLQLQLLWHVSQHTIFEECCERAFWSLK